MRVQTLRDSQSATLSPVVRAISHPSASVLMVR
jgi:hypothetical protein